MIDIVDSTKRKMDKPDKSWMVDFLQTFSWWEYRLGRSKGAGFERIKITGDGAMYWTPKDPEPDIRSAISHFRSELVGQEQKLEIRAAITEGEAYEITFEDNGNKDVYGIDIDRTARLLSHAGPGEIVINKPIADLLGGVEGLEGPWTFQLKGIGPTVAYKCGRSPKQTA